MQSVEFTGYGQRVTVETPKGEKTYEITPAIPSPFIFASVGADEEGKPVQTLVLGKQWRQAGWEIVDSEDAPEAEPAPPGRPVADLDEDDQAAIREAAEVQAEPEPDEDDGDDEPADEEEADGLTAAE